MKDLKSKQKKTRLTRKIVSALVVASLFAVAPSQVKAQDKASLNKEVTVKYLGTIDNQPVVRIEFDNLENASCYLMIKDEDGNILYSDNFRDQKFGKSFQLQRPDLDKARYSFVLTSSKQKITQSFEVSTNVRTIQDVVVTKL